MPAIDHCLELLKALILAKNAIEVMMPQSAQNISRVVSMKTHYQLSEVAILRLFDLLPSRFPPSSYTKDVLAMYCGYESYLDFLNKHSSSRKINDNEFDSSSPHPSQ